MQDPVFDYVIVGGGVAGCVLASRLSVALPDKSILLVEAGPEYDVRVAPSVGVFASDTSDILWNHRTVPQKGLDGNTIKQPQGKVLGGGSAVNYQTWTRGAAADFDRWALEVADKRWSWDGLLPYFKRSETFLPSKDSEQEIQHEKHGYTGPITVAYPSSSGGARNYPLKALGADIYETAGLKRNFDLNSGHTLGYGENPCATYNGQRQWAAQYPRGPNVTLWPLCQASKIIFSGRRTMGVEVLSTSGMIKAMARKEVIICSGVQNSPKLLLLSGIGPKAELSRHRIPQLVELPVGRNYSDHPFLSTFWKVRDRGLSLGDMVEMITPDCDWTAGVGLDWLSFHRHEDEAVKQLATQSLSARDFGRFDLAGRPHTESLIIYGHLDFTDIVQAPEASCMTLMNVLVAPHSRGTVTLASTNPNDPPILDPRFFSNPLDEKLIYECARMTGNAVQDSSLAADYGAVEYGIDEPLRNDWSDEALRNRLVRTCSTINHGSGTCAMGSVVDGECRVLGTQGLRVVDASVFPFPIGAHYQAAVYAVAEQMADIIAQSG